MARQREEAAHSPHDHDDEVQQIPAVPQVGVGVEEQAVGYHLEECLHREDDEEEVLHTLLEKHSGKRRGVISDCVYDGTRTREEARCASLQLKHK